MKQYPKIAAAIDYLVEHHKDQPGLDDVAAQAGYDSAHFQKLFKAYVGISPKRFLQVMNMKHAGQLLYAGASTLEAAMDTGLSGNGRLHDLFISSVAMRPGDVQKRGAGLLITYGAQPTSFGTVVIGRTDNGICWLGFYMYGEASEAVRKMRRHYSAATFVHDDDGVREEAEMIGRIWAGEVSDAQPSLKLDIAGTNFQIQVWQALLRIPLGNTVTYQDIAREIGRPTSSRAVGNAVGANPVSLLIPCHRVIRATGVIDNYAWGSARKKIILARE